jgi:hypothetical protein
MKISRQFLFKNYWWIVILLAVVSVLLIFYFCEDGREPLIASVLTTALAFCYFVQQQRLAEISLFKTLFTEFNARYDKLNGPLRAVTSVGSHLTDEQRDNVIDYFNLCAEEYLFYKEGYIHNEVWRSWCCGMLWYMKHEPFINIWQEEQTANSYYGLSLEVIRDGARPNKSFKPLQPCDAA